jgi:hypothetical protein
MMRNWIEKIVRECIESRIESLESGVYAEIRNMQKDIKVISEYLDKQPVKKTKAPKTTKKK